jgi:hypothetical protein
MFLIAINGLAKDNRSRIIARMEKYRKPFLCNDRKDKIQPLLKEKVQMMK